MNSKAVEIGDLIKKFERLVKRRLTKIPFPTNTQYEEAVERAFFKKHKEIENEIRELEKRMNRAKQSPAKQITVANKLRQNRWQIAISRLEAQDGDGYAFLLWF